jgi:hypothetical protein
MCVFVVVPEGANFIYYPVREISCCKERLKCCKLIIFTNKGSITTLTFSNFTTFQHSNKKMPDKHLLILNSNQIAKDRPYCLPDIGR